MPRIIKGAFGNQIIAYLASQIHTDPKFQHLVADGNSSSYLVFSIL